MEGQKTQHPSREEEIITIQGLHHITIVSRDAQRTVDFYTRVLGLRMVKQTVNFDDPGSYHLYFGDATGRPGTAITFFEWPKAPKGAPGIGGTHHLALQVTERQGLLKWKRRLTDLQIPVQGPYDRNYFESIYFRDPDGVILEIATFGPGFAIDEPAGQLGTEFRQPPPAMLLANRDETRIQAESWPEAVPAITADMALNQGMHHISAISADIQRTHDFYTGLLEIPLVKQTANFDDPNSAHWYWGVAGGRPGTLVTYFERNSNGSRFVRMGTGQTHHFALAVADPDTQLGWREKLMQAGWPVTQVKDRIYFKSIYTRDPDGHIVELATLGPGFLVDEDIQSLGSKLKLPPWLEDRRQELANTLRPLQIPAWNLERERG